MEASVFSLARVEDYFLMGFYEKVFLTFVHQVPSYVLMGISHGSASPVEPLLLTPMGEACLRMDLTAIHEMLEKAGYKDDEGIANEVSYIRSKFHIFFGGIILVS